MLCSDGNPCAFPCRKSGENGEINVADLPPNCPMLYREKTKNVTVLTPWRGRKLSAKTLCDLADLAFYGMSAAEKEGVFAGLANGGKISDKALDTLDRHRTYPQKCAEADAKGEECPEKPSQPERRIYHLFALAQNRAGKCDPVLDWFAAQPWGIAVESTLMYHLKNSDAEMPEFDEKKISIKDLNAMAGII